MAHLTLPPCIAWQASRERHKLLENKQFFTFKGTSFVGRRPAGFWKTHDKPRRTQKRPLEPPCGRVSRSGSGLSLTRSSLRERMVRYREEVKHAKAYLSESVLVQNSLLELRSFRRRYAARAFPPGGPEKEACRRGQAERLRETAFRPSWCAKHRPCVKHWGSILTIFSLAAMRLLPENHWG